VNQCLKPRQDLTSSNLVDMGWDCGDRLSGGERDDATPGIVDGRGGHEEGLRRTRGYAVGVKLGIDPVDRNAVNMGTVLVSPAIPRSQRGRGQVRCLLSRPGWGGAAVVVRDRESRSHGEGRQRISRELTGMPGGRR
jgi:hypothetical protein